MQTEATVIADSTNATNGVRVLSIELQIATPALPYFLMPRNFSRTVYRLDTWTTRETQRLLMTATVGTWLRLLRGRDVSLDPIRFALHASKPTELALGQWHLPYMPCGSGFHFERDLSVARCVGAAESHSGYADHTAERIADDLMRAGHCNPFEHQLTPLVDAGRRANFAGWESYRYQLGI